MEGLHKLAAYTDEPARRPLPTSTGRKWESSRRTRHSDDRDFLQESTKTAAYKQPSSWAPEGEDSPVSVIGHNMSMQLDPSHSSSSGSTSLEHSLFSFSSAASLHRPPQLMGSSPRLQSVAGSAPRQPSSATNYASLLSERVQQAFRKSNELQPFVVKTWHASSSSRQMEELNLQSAQPFQDCDLSDSQHSSTSGSCAPARDRQPAASSEEERLSIYNSSLSDEQDDEDSVIDFFPASKDVPKMTIVHKHESAAGRSGSACNGRNIKAQEIRRDLSTRTSSWIRRGNKQGEPNYRVDGHADPELGRAVASRKWEDAGRWLRTPTISAMAPGAPALAEFMHRPPFTTHVSMSNAAEFARTRPSQPIAEIPSSTQDKHVPESGASHATREAGTEIRKRDIATQSTPTDRSRCDSPEEAALCSSSAGAQTSPSLENVMRAGTTQKVSPARHNTPARRSVSCAKERGGVALQEKRGEGPACATLSLVELRSCHLEKLQLARDLPLGASPGWLVVAEDAAEAGRRCSPPNGEVAIKVNMLEARVAAWEEVERAKHVARFKREEAKIEAWEGLQRAEATAELQKLEVKLEKMRFEGREKIVGRMEAARRRAEEMRGIAEAQKGQQLARLATRATQLRKSGQAPSTAFNVMCSLTTKMKPLSHNPKWV